MSQPIIPGWLPVELITQPPGAASWLPFDASELREPFFHQTLARLRISKASAMRRTSLQTLAALGAALPHAAPAGLIFHVSRCGSTLISNALRTIAGVAVLSEAQPLNSILLPSPLWKADPIAQANLLDAVIRIFAHGSSDGPRRLVVKCTSWSLLSWPLIRAAFPGMPCLVVVRDPVEVLVSSSATPPGWGKRRGGIPQLLGWNESELASMSFEEYSARFVGALCEAALRMMGPNCMVLDYRRIDADSIRQVADFFGVPMEADGDLNQVLSVYSKDPDFSRPFLPDSEEKQAAATLRMREAAERWAAAPYHRLTSQACAMAG